MSPEDPVYELVRGLWRAPAEDPVAAILPRDASSLAGFYPALRRLVAGAPRVQAGQVDPGAIVRGEIVSMGEGSVVEAGAVIHDSCRLVLGARSRVRSGAVLRDEVVVGSDCLIGVHSEVFRSVLLGPGTQLGHFVLLADSIVGARVSVAGNAVFASSMLESGKSVSLKHQGRKIETGRSHLGAMVGDGVRFGASTTLCPGCIVVPGLSLPPAVVLYGVVDAPRRDALMRRFFEEWDV